MRKQEGLDLYKNAIFRYGIITDPDGHRLNMKLDLQSLFGLLCTVVPYSLAETPQAATPPPSPSVWAHTRGRYWSVKNKIDDISSL